MSIFETEMLAKMYYTKIAFSSDFHRVCV